MPCFAEEVHSVPLSGAANHIPKITLLGALQFVSDLNDEHGW
jgi:hypothetical protein